LLSFFSETFNGASTIRTFRRQQSFILENNRQLNLNIVANQWTFAVSSWFALRIDMISLAVLTFGSIFCIFYPSDGNKVFPVMLLTYMLLLQELVLWTVRCFTEIERRMVNVDRCLKLLDIP
jgi:ATP-binding cassette subfamily C (CFTR/MRP) protein 1